MSRSLAPKIWALSLLRFASSLLTASTRGPQWVSDWIELINTMPNSAGGTAGAAHPAGPLQFLKCRFRKGYGNTNRTRRNKSEARTGIRDTQRNKSEVRLASESDGTGIRTRRNKSEERLASEAPNGTSPKRDWIDECRIDECSMRMSTAY